LTGLADQHIPHKRPDAPRKRRAGTCHPHRYEAAQMTESISIKKTVGLPPWPVHSHTARRKTMSSTRELSRRTMIRGAAAVPAVAI
jgi:hypothetical protein